MNICFVGKRFYTNKDALTERFGRIYQLPLHWHEAGHHVRLLLLDYRNCRPLTSRTDGFDVTSLPVRSMWKMPGMARAQAPDVVIGSGDCMVGLAARHLARACGARFAFDIYDDYRTFAGYRLFMGWNAYDALRRSADMTWYSSQALAGPLDVKSAIVPNGVDPSMFRPLGRDASCGRVGLNLDHRWVGYFGSTEVERGVEDLVEAIGTLHASDARIRLVICGGGGDRPRYRQPWVDDRGNVSHASMPDYINACDVVTLPYRRGPTIDMAASCKMAEYLFCQRPIVATDTPSLRTNFPLQAIKLDHAIARAGDVTDLARAIQFQLRHALIAGTPPGFAWKDIAADALSTLQR